MPIYELGYRPWDGERVPPWRRWMAITRAEVGIALRSSKLLRRFVFLAWVPLVYFGPLFFAVGVVADPSTDLTQSPFWAGMLREFLSREVVDALHSHPEVFLPAIWATVFFFYFAYVSSWLTLLIVAIVAPPLISRDVRTKAFLLFFSKPIGFWEYFVAKIGVVLVFIAFVALLPALLLYAISVGFSPGIGTSADTIFIVLRIFLASLALGVPTAAVALLVSSLTRSRRVATFGWVALWGVGEMAFRMITLGATRTSGVDAKDWAYIFSLRELTSLATSRIFGVGERVTAAARQLETVGGDPTMLVRSLHLDGELEDQVRSAIGVAGDPAFTGGLDHGALALIYLTAISVVCAVVIMRRISRPVRI